jgi:hypothetical protein
MNFLSNILNLKLTEYPDVDGGMAVHMKDADSNMNE